MEDLYKILGVKRNASKAKIKEAYRKKSKEHHPDKQGDPQIFKVICEAYKILSNDERRKRYDATGLTEDTQKLERDSEDLLKQLFQGLLKSVGPQQILSIDVVKSLKQHLASSLQRIQEIRQKVEKALQGYCKIVPRIEHKNRDNMMSTVVAQEIQRCTAEIHKLSLEHEIIIGAQHSLEAYGFTWDKQDANWTRISHTNTGAIYTS